MTPTAAAVPADPGSRIARPRVDWVDFAKGLCIFAVVMFHANYHVSLSVSADNWLDYVVAFAKPFRMPDFFLIAGLFLSRVIDRPWRIYLDKKVVHFLYFYALWVSIYFALYHLRFALGGARFETPLWREYLMLYLEPTGPIWFIHLLPIFFIVTRLLRAVPAWVVLGVAIALQSFPLETGWGVADRFMARFVFFYTGYVFAPLVFQLAAWALRHRLGALTAIGLWAAVNATLVFADLAFAPGISLALGYAGAIAVVFTAVLLSQVPWMDWLRYLGEHSIVVYLAFLYPVEITLRVLLKLRWIADAGTIAVLVTLAGVGGAILFYAITKRLGARFLFERPAWARITPAANPLPAQPVPAPVPATESAL
jgi:uncharacterized membrane protein YcfT